MKVMEENVRQDKKVRNSALELLRILAMVMITFHHFGIHGGFKWETGEISATHFWYNLIILGGKVGVNIFVLITGYFLINSKGPLFNIKKVLKLSGQLIFYSVSIYLGACALGIIQFDKHEFVYSLFPITYSKWWFASNYFVLFLLHPFINKLLHSIDKRTYQRLLILLFICWSVIPTITKQDYKSNSLVWFVTIYTLAGYIRLYGLNTKLKSKHYFSLFFVFTAISYIIYSVLTSLGAEWVDTIKYIPYHYGQNTVHILLVSVSLFMAFATLQMKYHKWINVIASASFGVYLIHDNGIIRPILWNTLFKNAEYQDSLMLIPYSIVVVCIVFAVCTVIDLLRQIIFEKPVMMIVNKYADLLLNPINKLFTFFGNAIFGKD